MSEGKTLERGRDLPGGRTDRKPLEHRSPHSIRPPELLSDAQIEKDFLAAFTPPQIDQSPHPTSHDKKEKLIIPFNNTRINPDPRHSHDNPVVVFDKPVILNGSTYGYGAGSVERTEIRPGTQVRFLIAPDEQKEGMWNWFASAGEKTGFIWTRHRNRGTVITRRKGKDRVGTIVGKPQYDRDGKAPRIINFIVNDIVNY